MLLGCIADDFTGATDLAGTLVKEGMRTVQMIGVPDVDPATIDADAVVVALKSRTIPVADAVSESLAACDWLRRGGCGQILLKYCSTFDSTDVGNIGPVTEALADVLEAPFTIACPAFPTNGRLIFKGYLFVGDVLLNESGMQDHPLTPMTDPNLVRVLDRQTRGAVGLVPFDRVRVGAGEIAARFAALVAEGTRMAIVDATDDRDLREIGAACADLVLVTGGSGVALGLPENFRRAGRLAVGVASDWLPPVAGKSAVVSGSCSRATRAQVAHAAAHAPAFRLDARRLAESGAHLDEVLAGAKAAADSQTPLVYATTEPEDIKAIQAELGVERSSRLVEDALARVAAELVESGVRRLVVAGGETSGAVVQALHIEGLRIGAEIDPGVPWTTSLDDEPIALALKSGNFGSPDFFTKAFDVLAR